MFKTLILSISSVSVLFTRWCRPRQLPSRAWNSGWWRIRLTCSDSVRSIEAIIPWMVRTTSVETRSLSDSACCARVRPADSTRSACSVSRGRNLSLSAFSKADGSVWSWGAAAGAAVCVSVIASLSLAPRPAASRLARLVRRRLGGRARGRGQRLEEGRVLQQILHPLLGRRLPVHVGQEVGQLRARLEQLAQRLDLARHRRGREVVHALEGDVDAELRLAGQRVRDAERHPRLHRLHAVVEVVDVDIEHLPLVDGRQLVPVRRLARQVGHDAHDEGQLDLLLRPVDLDVVLDLHARRAVPSDELLTLILRHPNPSATFRCPRGGPPPARPRRHPTAQAPASPRRSSSARAAAPAAAAAARGSKARVGGSSRESGPGASSRPRARPPPAWTLPARPRPAMAPARPPCRSVPRRLAPDHRGRQALPPAPAGVAARPARRRRAPPGSASPRPCRCARRTRSRCARRGPGSRPPRRGRGRARPPRPASPRRARPRRSSGPGSPPPVAAAARPRRAAGRAG